MATAKYARRKDDEVSSSHEVSLQAELRGAIEAKVVYSLGKTKASATEQDWYQATALAIRDRVIDIWIQAKGGAKRERKKRVYYLSIVDTLVRFGVADVLQRNRYAAWLATWLRGSYR